MTKTLEKLMDHLASKERHYIIFERKRMNFEGWMQAEILYQLDIEKESKRI